MSDYNETRERAVATLRYLGLTVSDHGAVCAEFASVLYRGLHHFPSGDRGLRKVAWSDADVLRWNHYGELASFDGDELTVMVLMAHDLGLRLTVNPVNMRYLEIALSKCDAERHFATFHAHPTMESVLSSWREHHPLPEAKVTR